MSRTPQRESDATTVTSRTGSRRHRAALLPFRNPTFSGATRPVTTSTRFSCARAAISSSGSRAPRSSGRIKPERDQLFISSQLFQAVLCGAGLMAVLAGNDAHKLERKMGPHKFASCPPAMLLEPPRQVVRRPDVDVVTSALQGVDAPPLIALFQSDRCTLVPITYFLNSFS